MKKLLLCLILGLFACGEYDQQYFEGSGDGGAELGTSEEAISIGNNGFGFSTSNSHSRCAQPGVSGQDCRIPGNVTTNIKYCFQSPPATGLSETDKTALRKGIVEFDGQVTGYTFTETTEGSGTCQLDFVKTTVAGSGVSNAQDLSTFVPLSLTTLTSGAGASHVNGTWKSFSSAQAGIASQKIATQPFASLLAPIQLQHLGGYMASLFLGQGSTTSPSGNVPQYADRNNFDLVYTAPPGLKLFIVSDGDKCRINGRNSGGSTVVQSTFTCQAL